MISQVGQEFLEELFPPLPSDYEECGDCGYDHDYEYEAAAAWHQANPGSYEWEVSKNVTRFSLVTALVNRGYSEANARDLVARIEQGAAYLSIMHPDYMHDLVDQLRSIG